MMSSQIQLTNMGYFLCQITFEFPWLANKKSDIVISIGFQKKYICIEIIRNYFYTKTYQKLILFFLVEYQKPYYAVGFFFVKYYAVVLYAPM